VADPRIIESRWRCERRCRRGALRPGAAANTNRTDLAL